MDSNQSFLYQNNPMMNSNNILIPDNQQQQQTPIESITQELNNSGNPPMKQEEINQILNKPDSFDEQPKSFTYKPYLVKFIIILAVYLIFSIDTVKKIFSTIIINLYPTNNYLSIIGLIIYGAVLSAVCIGVEYKLGY